MILKKIRLRLENSKLGKRFVEGAFWSILGSVLGRGVILISFMLVARILGQSTYGELGIIRSTINMFTVFAGFGIGLTASKHIAQYRNSNPDQAGEIYVLSTVLSIIIGLISAIILIVLAPEIAEQSLNAPQLTNEIRIGAIVLFGTTVNGAQSGSLSGFEDFKSIAVNTLITGIVQGVTLVVFTFFWGITGSLIALGLGCIILALLNQRSIKIKIKEHNIKSTIGKIHSKTISVLWSFSLPTVLSSVMVIPILWWAKTFLIKKTSFSDMATFDIADQWSMMILFIPTTLSQIILPMLSNILVEGTKQQYIKLVKLNLIINIIISLFISLIIIAIAPFIMSLYGRDYTNSTPLVLMMLSSIMIAACNVVGQVIASRGNMWYGVVFNFVWGIWIVLFSLLFISKGFGASGLASAIVCAYFLHFIVQGVYLIKLLKNGVK